jgi:arylsulfatase A-like enzyme
MRIVSIALLLLAVLSQAEAEIPRRVIWIAIDSLRADHLSFAGYHRNTSPWIDELVPSSAVFTSAFSPSNSTGFSVAATFAGKHYSLMDHDSHPPHIPPDVETLPRVFQRGGVRTIGWITNAVLVQHGKSGFAHGFDEWHEIISKSSSKVPLDEVSEYVEANYEPTGGVEFHYIHTMDVHHPYVPPIPFDRLWPEHVNTGGVRYGSLPNGDGRTVLSNLPYHSEGHQLQDTDIAYLITQYDGAVRFTDTQLPALLQALGYDRENDLLIVSADHGEQLFDHNFWGHGKSLFPEEINVPLIIRGPGVVPGIHAGPVSLIDLFPTLCDLYLLEKPDGLSGVSLLPTLQGGEPVPLHTVYSEMPYWTGGVFAPHGAVIRGSDLYKFSANVNYFRPWELWPFAEELYHLDADPVCSTNVLEGWRERAAELNGVLRKIIPRFAPYTPEVLRRDGSVVELGPELLPELSPAGSERVLVQTPSIFTGENGGVSISDPGAQFHVYVSTDPGRVHLFEIEYTLVEGAFRLSMYDEKSGESLWEYTLRKPRDDIKKLRAMIKVPGDLSRLTVEAVEPGNGHFQSISLRVAAVPQLEVIQWRQAGTRERSEIQVDQIDTNNALDALGYVD